MVMQSHLIFKNDIQSVRTSKGYSQSRLAKAIDIRRDELSIIENGHRLPTKEIIEKIKQELGCLFSELYPLELQKIILKQ